MVNHHRLLAGAAGVGVGTLAYRALKHGSAPGNPFNLLGRAFVHDPLDKRALSAFLRAERRLKDKLGSERRVLSGPSFSPLSPHTGRPSISWKGLVRKQWVQHTVFTPAARKSCMAFWKFVYRMIYLLKMNVKVNVRTASPSNALGREGMLRQIDELLYRLMKHAANIAHEERFGLPRSVSNKNQASTPKERAGGILFWRITMHHVAQAKKDVIDTYLQPKKPVAAGSKSRSRSRSRSKSRSKSRSRSKS